jgi:hypothetical protein
MPQLLAVLEPGHSPDAARHAAEVLAAVARSPAEPNFLQTLLERAFEERGPSSVQVIWKACMPMNIAAGQLHSACRLTPSTAASNGWAFQLQLYW